MSHWENKGNNENPDERYTPLDVWFNMDVAAPTDRTHCHVPTEHFITANSLETPWFGFVWMNPPYGGRNSKGVWLDKLYYHGNGIACLPDRTSAPWWQKASRKCDMHLQVSGKIKFILPSGVAEPQPSNGTTLFAYGYRAVQALLRAQENGLGTCFKKA